MTKHREHLAYRLVQRIRCASETSDTRWRAGLRGTNFQRYFGDA